MAAERGDAEALKQLGDIYEKENALEAVKWYKNGNRTRQC